MKHQKPAKPSYADPVPYFVVDHGFDDVDDLAEAARAWDIDFRQLNRGAFRGHLLQAGCEGLNLGHVRLCGVLHQQAATPSGLTTFAIPRPERIDLFWRGHRVEPDEILIHHTGGELDSVSREDFDMLLISVSEEDLEQARRRQGLAPLSGRLDALEIVRSAPGALRNLRRWLESTLAIVVRDRETLTSPETTQAIRARASDFLTRCVDPDPPDRSPVCSARARRLVEHAVHLARHRSREITSVSDLCRESGASERTLRRGFSERFGVSPKAYLQAQRLIGVRRHLRAGGPGASVIDCANAWGFWHMGQFAKDYRRHFGELPSETRRGQSPIHEESVLS